MASRESIGTTPVNGRTAGRRRQGPQPGPRAVQSAITSSEIIAVGVLNLVRTTIVTALSGVQDVGAEIGAAAVAAVRGPIQRRHSIGADLGARRARVDPGNGRRRAASIGGELAARRAQPSRGAVKAAGDVGGDIATAAQRSVEGTARPPGARSRRPHAGQERRRGRHGGGRPDRAAAGRAVRATLSGTVAGMRSLVATVAPSAHPRRPPRASAKRSRAKHSRKVTTKRAGSSQ